MQRANNTRKQYKAGERAADATLNVRNKQMNTMMRRRAETMVLVDMGKQLASQT